LNDVIRLAALIVNRRCRSYAYPLPARENTIGCRLHGTTMTFEEEFRLFLKRYRVAYDERMFGTSLIIETHLQCVSFLIRIVFVVCQGVHLKRRQQSSTAQQRAKECLISRVSHVLVSFGQREDPPPSETFASSDEAVEGCSAGI
jgi:hypothetical protein